MATDPAPRISSHLSSKSLPVSPAWLTQFLSSQRTDGIPLPALCQTAQFRLLASDLTTSLAPTASQLLPTDISDANIKERRVVGPVPVQVLDIEDMSSSIWSQIEAIERVERGETTRGREIIRTVTRDEGGDVTVGNNTSTPGNPTAESNARPNQANNNNNSGTTTSSGPHRVILEDAHGTKVVSIELKRVEGVAIGKMSIGAKLVIKNAVVARGMLLLEPNCATLLGGKIESVDKAWNEGRKERLMAKIQQLQA